MICGHCKQTGTTVAHVKGCAGQDACRTAGQHRSFHGHAAAACDLLNAERAASVAASTAATASVRPSEPLHDVPCVCTPYDRCKGVRAQDAAGAATQGEYLRRLHRAYND